jgi:hypothetical protein
MAVVVKDPTAAPPREAGFCISGFTSPLKLTMPFAGPRRHGRRVYMTLEEDRSLDRFMALQSRP